MSFSSQKNLERCYCKHDSALSVHPCLSCCFFCLCMLVLILYVHTHTHNKGPLMKHILQWERLCFFFLTTEVMPTHVGCPSENKTVMLPQKHPETE